jgi:hypothetical protein
MQPVGDHQASFNPACDTGTMGMVGWPKRPRLPPLPKTPAPPKNRLQGLGYFVVCLPEITCMWRALRLMEDGHNV